jgi:hypothetical protein
MRPTSCSPSNSHTRSTTSPSSSLARVSDSALRRLPSASQPMRRRTPGLKGAIGLSIDDLSTVSRRIWGVGALRLAWEGLHPSWSVRDNSASHGFRLCCYAATVPVVFADINPLLVISIRCLPLSSPSLLISSHAPQSPPSLSLDLHPYFVPSSPRLSHPSSLTNSKPSSIYRLRPHLPSDLPPNALASPPATLGIEIAPLPQLEALAAQLSAGGEGKGKEIAGKVDVGKVAEKVVKNVSERGSPHRGFSRLGGQRRAAQLRIAELG